MLFLPIQPLYNKDWGNWVAENTPFDRLYFYDEDRDIHVSYRPEQKDGYMDFVITETERQVPKNYKGTTDG
jgi:hypothetical protein